MESQKTMVLPVVLKGNNYLLWARTAKTVLRSRGLWKYVEPQEELNGGESEMEEEEALPEAGEDESKEIQEDQFVLAVLQSSLEPSILAAYSYSETAKDLWATLKGVYGNLSNISRIYEVKKALNDLQQEEKSFKDMFGEFRGLWAELEMLRPPTVDPKELLERREQDQVFSLLLTLNSSYKDLIRHVLRFEKLPSLNEVCMLIQKEEGSRGLFQKTSEIAHFVHKPNPQGDKRMMECEHCKMKGHTKEKCWTLYPHLKPMRLRGSGQWSGQGPKKFAGIATTSGDGDVVRKADLEALIKSIAKLAESGKKVLTQKSVDKIIVDSGASHNMIRDAELLKDVRPCEGRVTIADGKNVSIRGIGKLELFEKDTNALYVPDFKSNLLSVCKVTKDLDCLAIFGANAMQFQDTKTRNVIGEGKVKEGLYVLCKEEGNHSSQFLENDVVEAVSFGTNVVGASPPWHERLGHPSVKVLNVVLPNHTQDVVDCEACILGKHCRMPFTDSSTVYDECFALVHSDVWTSPCTSRDKYKYFVSFIDEKSKYTWVTLLSSKDLVFEAFTKFYNYVLTQYKIKIRILRSDNGGEFINRSFKEFAAQNGMIHQTSCPYTPQQNGVAERKNRHLLEVTRTLMFAKGVPKRFWADGVVIACYLINRLPAQGLGDKSPFEILNGQRPSLSHLRVFGCKCHVFIPEGQRDKLEPRSVKCMFIGYSTTQKGYKCLQPETNRIYVSREVRFDERNGFFEEKEWENLGEITLPNQDGEKRVQSIPVIISTQNGDMRSDGESLSNIEERHDESDNTSAQNQEESQTTTEETSDGFDSQVEEAEESSNQNESESTIEVPTPTQVLRRSQRQRFGPENWKNTRVYYNGLADHQQESKRQGIQVTMDERCSGCTASLSALPIGNSVSYPSSNKNTLQKDDLTKKDIRYPIQAYYSTINLSFEDKVYLSKIDEENVPKSYEEACSSKVWTQAMKEEIESMEKNNTWDMTELPKGKKTVGCRWVFTTKYKSNGEVERYKARLVAKGYTQVYGEDYTETFAPVAKLHSVRVLLSVAVNSSWKLWQMDVKNAFLQGELEEEVYMVAPQGYCKNASNQVCKLRKAIYGLKQSPRAWYQRLSGYLEGEGFEKSEADHTLFTKRGRDGLVAILIYVDDIIITGDDEEGIKKTKGILKNEFDIKDLGELKYFLGIEMIRSEEGLFISQRKYVLDLLTESGKLGTRPAKTPIEDGYQDGPDEEIVKNVKQYQRTVGKLIYLTITRPDICFAVNRVSQHMQAPTAHHWSMVERILRYLKGSPGKGVWLKCNGNTELMGYCDADWAGDKKDRKSTTGYCTFVGGNLVTWRSKKQKVIALSSAEAEYRAMKEVTKELVWLKSLLKDLGIHETRPIILHCDNQAAIHIATNPVFHERTKHIEVDCHYVRGKIQEGIITTKFVKSEDQVADIFTKATTSLVCNYIHNKIGLLDLYQPTLRGSVETNDTNELSVEECGNQAAGMSYEMDYDGYGLGRMDVGCDEIKGEMGQEECMKCIEKALSPNKSIWHYGECSYTHGDILYNKTL